MLVLPSAWSCTPPPPASPPTLGRSSTHSPPSRSPLPRPEKNKSRLLGSLVLGPGNRNLGPRPKQSHCQLIETFREPGIHKISDKHLGALWVALRGLSGWWVASTWELSLGDLEYAADYRPQPLGELSFRKESNQVQSE